MKKIYQANPIQYNKLDILVGGRIWMFFIVFINFYLEYTYLY